MRNIVSYEEEFASETEEWEGEQPGVEGALVSSREGCAGRPGLVRNKTHPVDFSDEGIMVTLVRESSVDG